jgi:hypothetical protein
VVRAFAAIVFLLVSHFTFGQLWSEDFSLPDGITTNPPDWITDVSGANFTSQGHFQVVSGQMEGKGVGGEVIWYGDTIDISASANVAISMLVSESGGMESTDYFRAFYVLDGGPENLIGELTDDIPGGGPVSLSVGNLNGSTLQVVVRLFNNANNEEWRFDDVTISVPAYIYSINTGSWSDTNNWSFSSGGPTCNCVPSSLTQVEIEGGNIIDFDVTSGVIGLNITGSSQLIWAQAGGSLTIDGVGSLVVDVGSSLLSNGNSNAVVIFSSGGNLVNNNASTQINLESVEVNGSSASFNMTGAGGLTLNSHLSIGGTSITATNSMSGVISVLDYVGFPQNTINSSFTNNGIIQIGNDFYFNHQGCALINNGDIVITDDIQVVSNSDVNNSIINNSGANISLHELRLGNADGFILDNYGTFSLSDDIIGVVANNQINNLTGAVLNYGGSNPDAQVALEASTPNNLVNYNGSSTLNILIPTTSYYNLEVSGTSTKTLPNPVTIGGDLTVFTDLDLAGNNISLGGNLDAPGIITTGPNTITLIGDNQSINAGTNSLNNLSVSGTGTKFFTSDVTILGDLTIESMLDPGSGRTVTIEGNLINNGSLVNTSEILRFTGTNAQIISGSALTSVSNMTVEKTGGSLAVNSAVNLLGTMEIPAPSNIDFDGSGTGVFTLVSNASNDARIGEVAAGSNLTGDLTFEKYFVGIGAKYWRHIGSPVTGATVADLQNEIPVSGSFIGTNNGTGTIPSNAYPSLYYYDPASGLATATLDDRWVVYPVSTNTEVLNSLGNMGRGYAAWIRDTGPVTFDLSGLVNYGTIDFNLSGANEGWNLLANPYPSDIDWNNPGWTKTDIQGAAIHVWDGSQYLTWNGTTGSLGNGRIAKGQGFWVQAATTAAQLVADETVKTSTAAATYRLGAPEIPVIELTVRNGQYKDQAFIQFSDDAQHFYDIKDADKLQNSIYNLSSLSLDSVALSINVLNAANCEFEVPLSLTNAWLGDYSMTYNINEAVSSSYEIMLVDKFTEQHYVLTRGEQVNFILNDEVESQNINRFYLVFTPLAINPDLTLTTEQNCENESSAWLLIQGTQLNIDYSIFVNNLLIDTRKGTGTYLEYELEEGLSSGINQIKVIANASGCLSGEIEIMSQLGIITTPQIEFDAETGLLKSSDLSSGLWYWDNELLSSSPSSSIRPNLVQGGTYRLEVSNDYCTKSSEEFIITDITELDKIGEVSINPNPAIDFINVSTTNKINRIIISDVVGKVFLNTEDVRQNIPVSNLQSGIYIITLLTESGELSTRFIKQ